MPPYSYSPLGEGAREIRLLTLLPGEFCAPIRILIQTTHFGSQDKPQYDALSYAWGRADDTVNIYVQDSADDILAIAKNLANALPYLRYADKSRVLWVDAICIDQQNPKERGHQVGQMADIFRTAERVIAWLGSEADSSALAFKVLRKMSFHIEVDWELVRMRPARKSESDLLFADLDVALPYDEVTLRAIWQLLSRSWFERLWVQQEIRLANSRAILVCGYDTMLWKDFRDAILCLYLKKAWIQLDFHQRLQRVYDMCDLPHFQSIVEILGGAFHFRCADPRDRVYGLLSLMDETGKKVGIKPDYTKTTREVYIDLVLQYTQELRHLGVLRYCQMQGTGISMSMPSWVPDWTTENQMDIVDVSNASGGISCEVQYISEGILKAAGVFAATVTHIVEISKDIHSNERLCREIQKLVPPEAFHVLYAGGGWMFEAYCRTFCCSQFSESCHYTGYPSQQQSITALEAILNNDLGPLEGCKEYVSRVRSAFRGRSLFKTKKGFIGLAPKESKVGDQICIVLGCPAPLVLRPTNSGRHQVVGAAYMDVLIEGQAILGRLPDGVGKVMEDTLDDGLWPAYMHINSGKYLNGDPRLGPAPAGWRIKHHKREHLYSWLVNDETGEDSVRDGDPRLTPDALRARGVKLKEFHLV
jgi:hypothetical protein